MIIIERENEITWRAVGEAFEFARRTGQLEQLADKLEYLASYGSQWEDVQAVRCHLYKDFAPYSFTFTVEWMVHGRLHDWRQVMNGGLIYHGAHDNGGYGGAPTFSVNLSPHGGWSIHT